MTTPALKDLHPAQLAVLHVLRHRPAARYSELCKAADMESDTFKFHIRRLVYWQVVSKTQDGQYVLTACGKEYANKIDYNKQQIQRQPKQSMLVIIRSVNTVGEAVILMQTRKRHPFWGKTGLVSGPILWGELPEVAGSNEVYKQTGLYLTLDVAAYYRQRIILDDADSVHDDILFCVMEGNVAYQSLLNSWYAGENVWIKESDVDSVESIFPATKRALSMTATGRPYSQVDLRHSYESY